MRQYFVRNAANFAVNFCKKCSQMRGNIFFTAFTAFLTLICHKCRCGEFRGNLCVKAVKSFFFHRISRISYISLTQKSMQWIFIRNAVNFAVDFWKKCGEMLLIISLLHSLQSCAFYKNSPYSPHFSQKLPALTAFLTKVHRIHCISYKRSSKNLDPGGCWYWFSTYMYQ